MMENLTLSEFQKVKKSKFGWNFNIMDGLGWILKIFKQTHQKRPEAKVNLRGHQTNKVKMISIHFWGTPTTHTCILEAW